MLSLLCSCIQLVQNPGVSIVGYSQPDRFFQPYKKLKERRRTGGLNARLPAHTKTPHISRDERVYWEIESVPIEI